MIFIVQYFVHICKIRNEKKKNKQQKYRCNTIFFVQYAFLSKPVIKGTRNLNEVLLLNKIFESLFDE